MTADDIVRGMAKEARWVLEGPNASYENAIRAALQWLTDNVSDEMISAAIRAAIRAAAEGKR